VCALTLAPQSIMNGVQFCLTHLDGHLFIGAAQLDWSQCARSGRWLAGWLAGQWTKQPAKPNIRPIVVGKNSFRPRVCARRPAALLGPEWRPMGPPLRAALAQEAAPGSPSAGHSSRPSAEGGEIWARWLAGGVAGFWSQMWPANEWRTGRAQEGGGSSARSASANSRK